MDELLTQAMLYLSAFALGATIAITAIERRERRRLRDAQRRLDELQQRMTNS